MEFNGIISVIAKAKYLLRSWFLRRRHSHVFLCQERGRRSSSMSESCSFIGERREDGQPANVVAETELSHLLFSPGTFAVRASPMATSLWQPRIGWDAWSRAPTEGGWVQLGAPVQKESTNQIVPCECFQAIAGLSQTVWVTVTQHRSTIVTHFSLVWHSDQYLPLSISGRSSNHIAIFTTEATDLDQRSDSQVTCYHIPPEENECKNFKYCDLAHLIFGL